MLIRLRSPWHNHHGWLGIKNWSPIYHAQGTITQAVSDLNAKKCVWGGGGCWREVRGVGQCVFSCYISFQYYYNYNPNNQPAGFEPKAIWVGKEHILCTMNDVRIKQNFRLCTHPHPHPPKKRKTTTQQPHMGGGGVKKRKKVKLFSIWSSNYKNETWYYW